MGHIVNAKGFRLGINDNWVDNWFSESQFYCQYLHSLYRIRFYLIYIFSFHFLEREGFFFSHFDIIKSFKHLKINIFFYDGKSETIFADMFHEFTVELKHIREDMDPENKIWLGIFEPYKIIGILGI